MSRKKRKKRKQRGKRRGPGGASPGQAHTTGGDWEGGDDEWDDPAEEEEGADEGRVDSEGNLWHSFEETGGADEWEEPRHATAGDEQEREWWEESPPAEASAGADADADADDQWLDTIGTEPKASLPKREGTAPEPLPPLPAFEEREATAADADAEAEAARKAEEAERARREAEAAEAKKKAEAEAAEAKKKAEAEAEAKKKADAEAAEAKKKAERDAKKRAEAEAAQRRREQAEAEEKARREAEEKRLAAEVAERIRLEEEEAASKKEARAAAKAEAKAKRQEKREARREAKGAKKERVEPAVAATPERSATAEDDMLLKTIDTVPDRPAAATESGKPAEKWVPPWKRGAEKPGRTEEAAPPRKKWTPPWRRKDDEADGPEGSGAAKIARRKREHDQTEQRKLEAERKAAKARAKEEAKGKRRFWRKKRTSDPATDFDDVPATSIRPDSVLDPSRPSLWRRYDLGVVVFAASVLAVSAFSYRLLTTPRLVPFSERGLTFERPESWLPPVPVEKQGHKLAGVVRTKRKRADEGDGGSSLPFHVVLQSPLSPMSRIEVRITRRPRYRNWKGALSLARVSRYGETYWSDSSAEESINNREWSRTLFRYAYIAHPGDSPKVATAIEYANLNGDTLYTVTFHGGDREVERLRATVAPTLTIDAESAEAEPEKP